MNNSQDGGRRRYHGHEGSRPLPLSADRTSFWQFETSSYMKSKVLEDLSIANRTGRPDRYTKLTERMIFSADLIHGRG